MKKQTDMPKILAIIGVCVTLSVSICYVIVKLQEKLKKFKLQIQKITKLISKEITEALEDSEKEEEDVEIYE